MRANMIVRDVTGRSLAAVAVMGFILGSLTQVSAQDAGQYSSGPANGQGSTQSRGSATAATQVPQSATEVAQARRAAAEQRNRLFPRNSAQAETKSVLREDFDSELSLNWYVLRENRENISLTTHPGELTIITERGSIFEDQENDKNADGGRAKNIHVIANPLAADGDFQITTKLVDFKPYMKYHQAGLIVYQDDDNYVKFTLLYRPNLNKVLSFMWEKDATPALYHVTAEQEPEDVWLRITRRGNTYAASMSYDGESFQNHASFQWEGEPKLLGLIAKNGGAEIATPIEARFEFFEMDEITRRSSSSARGVSPGRRGRSAFSGDADN